MKFTLAKPSFETSRTADEHSRLATNTSLKRLALNVIGLSISQELHSTGMLTLLVFVDEYLMDPTLPPKPKGDVSDDVYWQHINTNIELILNLLLIIFLLYFIWNKIRTEMYEIILRTKEKYSLSSVVLKTLGFTYLNPHVYSDTVFFLGNFSKDFILKQKIFFGFGASVASIIFFFTIGYTSKYLSRYIITKKFWKIINLIIIIFMSFLTIYVIKHTMQFIFINGR